MRIDNYRVPDETRTADVGGLEVTIRIFLEPTDAEWDGDYELEEGAEGWDIDVIVSARLPCDYTVKARASCAGFWFVPDREGQKWFDSEVEGVCAEAIEDFKRELRLLADPTRPERARERARAEMYAASAVLARIEEK